MSIQPLDAVVTENLDVKIVLGCTVSVVSRFGLSSVVVVYWQEKQSSSSQACHYDRIQLVIFASIKTSHEKNLKKAILFAVAVTK